MNTETAKTTAVIDAINDEAIGHYDRWARTPIEFDSEAAQIQYVKTYTKTWENAHYVTWDHA